MPIPLIVAGAEIALKAGSAYLQGQTTKRNAERLAANRPYLPANTFAQDQQDLAGSELSTEQNRAMKSYDEMNSRDFSNSLGSILKGGGDVNDVGSLFDGSQAGRKRALLATENIRMNNINNVIRSYQNGNEAQQQQFQFNQWAPWADAAQANAQARVQANNKLWGAVDDAGGLAMRAYAGQGTQTNGGYDPGMGVSSTSVNSNSSNYAVPSVSSHFNTIDPNKLNNWSLNP